MHTVGKIDRNIYKCITDDIMTDEVVITDNHIRHIKERHPEAYENILEYVKHVIQDPDYIIEDNKHSYSGLVVKKIPIEKGHLMLALRICTVAETGRL